MKTIILKPVAPFDFSYSVNQIESWSLTFFHAWTGATYFQSLSLDTFSTAFSLTWNQSVENPELALDVPENLSDDHIHDVVQVITRQFSLNYDLNRVMTGQTDEKLKELVRNKWGYHPVIFPSPWECIAHSIISSQVSDRLTRRILEQLMENYGTKVEWQGMDFWCFPRPDQFAKATETQLREMSLSRQKADYLGGLSSKLAKGEIQFNAWFNLDGTEIIGKLMEIRGIGKFTASFAVPFGFGKLDAIIPMEGGFRRVVEKVYDLPGITDDQYNHLLDQWGEFRELAMFFVWNEFDRLKAEEKQRK